ncbi:hypothetical protein NL676_026626 [Syzygium grande]|nr:hypothetical protein NL676_026626 [Syzygium grande]
MRSRHFEREEEAGGGGGGGGGNVMAVLKRPVPRAFLRCPHLFAFAFASTYVCWRACAPSPFLRAARFGGISGQFSRIGLKPASSFWQKGGAVRTQAPGGFESDRFFVTWHPKIYLHFLPIEYKSPSSTARASVWLAEDALSATEDRLQWWFPGIETAAAALLSGVQNSGMMRPKMRDGHEIWSGSVVSGRRMKSSAAWLG